VTPSQIRQAFIDAQAGFDPEKAYRVGDSGKSQMIYKVLSDNFISETHNFLVTEVNAKHILYQDAYTIHSRSADEADKHGESFYEITKATPTPSPTPASSSEKKLSPGKFSNTLIAFFNRAKKLLSSISIEFSTAVGKNLAQDISKSIDINNLITHRILENDLQKRFFTTQDLSTKSLTPSEPRESRYYGLRSFKHRFITNNCSQLADCRVNATHIQYNEITTDKDGQPMKIHWIYEISIEVPGIFTVLEECYSTLVKQDNSQLPLTICSHVENFKFGFADPK